MFFKRQVLVKLVLALNGVPSGMVTSATNWARSQAAVGAEGSAVFVGSSGPIVCVGPLAGRVGASVTAGGGTSVGAASVAGELVGFNNAFLVNSTTTVSAAAVKTAFGLTCSVALADGRLHALNAKTKTRIKTIKRYTFISISPLQ
jgi:hypothetical protein